MTKIMSIGLVMSLLCINQAVCSENQSLQKMNNREKYVCSMVDFKDQKIIDKDIKINFASTSKNSCLDLAVLDPVKKVVIKFEAGAQQNKVFLNIPSFGQSPKIKYIFKGNCSDNEVRIYSFDNWETNEMTLNYLELDGSNVVRTMSPFRLIPWGVYATYSLIPLVTAYRMYQLYLGYHNCI